MYIGANVGISIATKIIVWVGIIRISRSRCIEMKLAAIKVIFFNITFLKTTNGEDSGIGLFIARRSVCVLYRRY